MSVRNFSACAVVLLALLGGACGGSSSRSGGKNTQAKPATSSTTSVASMASPSTVATAASWTVAPTQSVDGNEVVGGTSCVSNSFCVAVGTGPQLGWDGSRWAQLPGSESATGAGDGSFPPTLASASCVSEDFCMAVGFTAQGPSPLARVWNGKTWNGASPSSPSSGYMLNGVSCVSADDCWAVGLSGTTSTGIEPIAVHWNGSSWEAAAVPSQGDDQLAAVSCTSSRFCMAVGTSNFVSASKETPFTVVWNGSEWSVRQAAAFSSTGGIELQSVSCTSPTTCMAVGGDTLNASSPPIAQWWDGNRWSNVSTAVGDGASSAYFASVSCSQAKSCMAVGTTGIGGSHGIAGTPLAEKWDGSTWSFVQTPSPDDGGLVGVSCTSPAWCVAAGGVFPNVYLLRWGP